MGFKRNSINNRGVEEIDTSVDSIGDELLRLFDETFNSTLGIGNNDTILSRILDLSEENSTFLLVILVEFEHVTEGEIADNITV